MEQKELVISESISKRTLEDMDEAIANFMKGNVSAPVDLSDFSSIEESIDS